MIDDVPVFGEPTDDLPHVPRPGAYAIARDDRGRIATVVIHGTPHLPGGGVDPEESTEEALLRELGEELALSATILSTIGRASQWAPSYDEGTCFLKQGTFFEVALGARLDGAVAEYELTWWEAERFLQHASDGSHAWAIRRLLACSAS